MKGRGYPTASPIARMVPQSRSDVQVGRDTRDLRARLWREEGVAAIDPEDIDDDWLRQGLINEAEKQFGRRGKCHAKNGR